MDIKRVSRSVQIWMLLVPTVLIFYLGLFLTMKFWYPAGLSQTAWQTHVVNFSIVYLIWIIIFFANRLFEPGTFQSRINALSRLGTAFVMCAIAAVIYFYLQPTLILTPRRFLLVHLFISGVGISTWYLIAQKIFPYTSRSLVFSHSTLEDKFGLQTLLDEYSFVGLKYQGVMDVDPAIDYTNTIVVFPRTHMHLEQGAADDLFKLRRFGVRFIEYHQLYEQVTRQVSLQALTELWFIDSVDYGAHRIFDLLKRLIDVALGLIGFIVFAVTFPIVALLIKLTSRGTIFFSQARVGKLDKPFTLYKYRTMSSGGATDTWTELKDKRITPLGKFLRLSRIDELPQSINILKGNMSIVGPRPEQVNIVKDLETQIPYYGERHLVKPGLTGWAQLHVYAGSLEETKRKLQYDLYYIKHRSLLFDLEIILKTVYNIITLAGR